MKFAVDVSDIQPGDSIEQSECERLIGFSRESDRYGFQFHLMQLAEHITRELWKIGKHYTVTTKDGAVKVLTHEQASKHNAKTFRAGLRKSRKSFKRLTAVDVGVLSAEARNEHTEAVIKQSRILQAINKRSVDSEPIPVVRNTPTLVKA